MPNPRAKPLSAPPPVPVVLTEKEANLVEVIGAEKFLRALGYIIPEAKHHADRLSHLLEREG